MPILTHLYPITSTPFMRFQIDKFVFRPVDLHVKCFLPN